MRTLSSLVTIVLLFAVSAKSAQAQWRGRRPYGPPPGYGGAYGMAGCGLGAVIFGPLNEPGAQVLAATTNATFSSQTFGISSGTSNCVSGGVVAVDREQTAFAEVNFTDLKYDMASGGGQYLSAFATLLGCSDGTKPALAKMMQARYEALLPSDRTTPVELIAAVHAQIGADPQLAVGCTGALVPARTKGDTARAGVDSSAPAS
jgi:hypothetical protein